MKKSESRDIVIVFFLEADGGIGAMTGYDPGFVGQVVKAVPDGVCDLVIVSAGEIGSADPAVEERIAGSHRV